MIWEPFALDRRALQAGLTHEHTPAHETAGRRRPRGRCASAARRSAPPRSFARPSAPASRRPAAAGARRCRGPLAGPVVSAAVILPENFHLVEVNDSKQLSLKKREELFDQIMEQALAVGIGIKDEQVIDSVNIYEATKLAMKEAVRELAVKPDCLLIDAMALDLNIPQEKIIKGDAKSISIACASIIAKVTRDKMMESYHEQYPGYGFDKNSGYGTKEHLEGLKLQGITPIHRKTFAPIKEMI